MHSCITSCIFVAQTLDLVLRYEAVVFRRYVLALLSVDLLRKFEAYLVYLSLIWTKNPGRFSFFQKFRHFTYMLLWFHLVIPSFPSRIDDMRSRFSALSVHSPAWWLLHPRSRNVLLTNWSACIMRLSWYLFFLFYFIYLPHTIKYIINKNAKDYNK